MARIGTRRSEWIEPSTRGIAKHRMPGQYCFAKLRVATRFIRVDTAAQGASIDESPLALDKTDQDLHLQRGNFDHYVAAGDAQISGFNEPFAKCEAILQGQDFYWSSAASILFCRAWRDHLQNGRSRLPSAASQNHVDRSQKCRTR